MSAATIDKKFVGTEATAKVYDVSEQTIRAWTRLGMPHVRAGRFLKYDLESVQRWLDGFTKEFEAHKRAA